MKQSEHNPVNPQTIAIGPDGEVLLRVADLLVAVKVGQDFYVGQKRYVVKCVETKGNAITVQIEPWIAST